MARTHGPGGSVTLEQPDRDTLALGGELTFTTVARTLTEAVRVLASGAQTRLDLAGLTRADSAGLACVIALAATASRAGRTLRVTHWPEGLRALAEVCGALPLLEPAEAPAA
jgi:phospholipid transport system transporter-binding protein